MNKTKKIAFATVAVVMAGSMALSIVGCGETKTTINNPTGSNQTLLTPTTDENGKLTWSSDTKLNVSIGHNSAKLGAAFNSDNIKSLVGYLGGETSANLYGTTYSAGSFKPAWAALANQLGVTFVDKYTGKSSDDQLAELKKAEGGLASVDIFTSSASDLSNEASSDSEAILDLTKYLDYMPNYKAFLESSATTRLSLTAGSDGAMYLAPYFDGNDDIEKYVLLRKDLVETLLNSTDTPSGTISFKTQAAAKATAGDGTSTSVTSFMGTTSSWEIEVTDPSVLKSGTQVWGNDATEVTNSTKTIKIKVDYDKALADAKSSESGTMGAILAAAGVASSEISGQTSGNIIDIMNVAINNTNGEVNGSTLISLLRRYISVTYTYNNTSFYGASGRKLADVFNSAYAAWDADLYTALGRCFVTSGTYLGSEVKSTENLFLLTGRQNRTDRFNDTVALAGELYGVRGLESRYQYTYITADGVITDARTNTSTFEALQKMNDLTKEGLFAPLVDGVTITNGEVSHSGAKNSGIQSLSLHDYVQTQTANQGYRSEDAGEANSSYNFAPVLTSVSNWDTNDDGTKDTIMRFTESWRSVKTTGFGISYKGVKDDPDKLAACLAFVDYLFSNDGQILMTYGPQAQANDSGSVADASSSTGGFWYGNKVTNVSLSDTTKFKKISDATNYAPAQYESLDSNYFVYNETVYTGTYYNGKQIPTMTASSKAMFRSSTLGNNSFTNYARYFIGTTLPIGNKDQGFEYQCTAKCGLAGADIVAIALNNGTIQHPVQQIPTLSTNEKNDWYTLVPSTLFYDSDVTDVLKQSTYTVVTGFGTTTHIFTNSSSSSGNFFHDIEAYGFDSTKNVTLLSSDNIKLPSSATAAVTFLNNYNMNTFQEYIREAFENLVAVYVTK